MIYRAPERSTPARGRAVTHELAALLVGMALLAAVILQFACAGAGPDASAGRWICVNNARLAALRPATPTPTGTARAGRGGAIRPIAQATSIVPSAPTMSAIGSKAPDTEGLFGSWPTPTVSPQNDALGYPGAGRNPSRSLPSPSVPVPDPFDARRTTLTALAAEGLAAATARALANQSAATATVTATTFTTTGTASPTPTPGPGTPSVTPGPTPTDTASPTETGYP